VGSSPVADQEPEVGNAIIEIHQAIADLPHCPRAVRVRGDADDLHVVAADLEQAQGR
jgi:hypothetical protein